MLPKGLENYEIINIKAIKFAFFDYKYSNAGEVYPNGIIEIKMKHYEAESCFYIDMFCGTTYNEAYTSNITISTLPSIIENNNSVDFIEPCYCASLYEDDIKYQECFKEIVSIFKNKVYSKEQEVIDIPPFVFEDIIRDICKLDNLTITETINLEKPDSDIVKKVYSELLNVSSNKLYVVSVVYENKILVYSPFLSVENAEELFKSLCIEYTPDFSKNKEKLSLLEWKELISENINKWNLNIEIKQI